MNFDKRFNNALSTILGFVSSPFEGLRKNEPLVDPLAREAIVALQSQLEHNQRVLAVIHGWMVSKNGLNLGGTKVAEMLDAACDYRAPEFPQEVLATATGDRKQEGVKSLEDVDEEESDIDPYVVQPPSAKPLVGAHKETGDEEDEDDPEDSGMLKKKSRPAVEAMHRDAHQFLSQHKHLIPEDTNETTNEEN